MSSYVTALAALSASWTAPMAHMSHGVRSVHERVVLTPQMMFGGGGGGGGEEAGFMYAASVLQLPLLHARLCGPRAFAGTRSSRHSRCSTQR